MRIRRAAPGSLCGGLTSTELPGACRAAMPRAYDSLGRALDETDCRRPFRRVVSAPGKLGSLSMRRFAGQSLNTEYEMKPRQDKDDKAAEGDHCK